MAAKPSSSLGSQFAGLSQLAAHRQFGIILGLAVVIALGTALVMWASKPNFIPLYEVSREDFTEAQQALGREGIPWMVDQEAGTLMVAATRRVDAEVALSDAQISGGRRPGFEALSEALPIGISEDDKRLRRFSIIAAELERTIEQFAGVVTASVSIAGGTDTSFIRQSAPVTATVTVKMASDRTPTKRLVDAIVNTVAGAVSGLDPSNVTVNDVYGSLTDEAIDSTSAQRSEQLEFKRDYERDYRQRIFDILSPVIGQDRLRASVDARIDFTQIETASESYGSDTPAVLSESIQENEAGAGGVGGIPGSLTNQPPVDAVVADDLDVIGAAVAGNAGGTQSSSRSSTRNFQNDRVVTHTSLPTFQVSNLSISVIVDYKEQTSEDGEVVRVPRTAEELQRYENLIRSAVGFDAARGDTLTIDSDSFLETPAIEVEPEEPIWMQPWVLQVARYLAGGIALLLLVLIGIRPVLKSLAAIPPPPKPVPAADPALAVAGGAPAQMLQSQQTAAAEAALGQARKVAEDDPKLVAQVVRQWMDNDGK